MRADDETVFTAITTTPTRVCPDDAPRWMALGAYAKLVTSARRAKLIKCPGAFQNALGAFRNVITYVTLRHAPRGRPDLAGCLPRCVRTGGRVKLCGKIVPVGPL